MKKKKRLIPVLLSTALSWNLLLGMTVQAEDNMEITEVSQIVEGSFDIEVEDDLEYLESERMASYSGFLKEIPLYLCRYRDPKTPSITDLLVDFHCSCLILPCGKKYPVTPRFYYICFRDS